MEKYEQVSQRNRKQIFLNNFIGGIAWGLGATIGASILLAILGIVAGKINTVPLIGSFVSEVVVFVEENKSHFKK